MLVDPPSSMDSSPLSLPALVRAMTPTHALARAATPTPAPVPTPAPEIDVDQLPQHTKPSRIKVKELPEKQRKRAESTACHLAKSFEDARIRATLSHISKVRDESHICPERGNRTGWAFLQVEKRQQRETMPVETRADMPSRPPPRLAVSAPVMRKDSLMRPVPGSPMGNAWSGEHFWKPQFCESVPASPMWKKEGCAHSDAARKNYYASVVADVEKCVLEVKAEIALGDEQLSDAECDVIAAITVLEEIKAGFGENDWPVPKDILAKAKEFGQEEKKALESHPIHGHEDICESDNWLHFEQSSLQPSTKLDEVRGRLKMIKEMRRNAGIEPPERGYRLVYAVQILEEKIRTLKAHDSYANNSDDEMVEYGKFLKSLVEVLPAEEVDDISMASSSSDSEFEKGNISRRDVSECGIERKRDMRRDVSENGLERRRLRGKAPSTLDLESWASELKVLDDKSADGPCDEDLFF